MARYKRIDTSPRFIAVDLERQLLPGTFEHALNHLIDIDQTGASAYPPGMLLKVILFAYTRADFARQAAKLEAAAQTKLSRTVFLFLLLEQRETLSHH